MRSLSQSAGDRRGGATNAGKRISSRLVKTAAANHSHPTELERAGQLLADTAHDLRGSLAATRELVKIVADGFEGPVSESQASFLQSAVERCNEMHQLIENMLDAERLTTATPAVLRSEVDLKQLVRSLSGILAPLARARCVEMQIRVHGADSPGPYGDIEHLRRILVNLGQNAIKASTTGSRVAIGIESRRLEGMVRFTVSDQAGGLHPSLIADATRRGISGGGSYGLGLSIATQLAALHFGRLDLTSVPGRHTQLGFGLPVAAPRPVVSAYLNWRADWLNDTAGEPSAEPKRQTLPPRIEPPAHPDQIAMTAIRAGMEPPVIEQLDRTIQSEAGYHELAYRTGKNSWIMLWDADVDGVWRRLDKLRGRIVTLGRQAGVSSLEGLQTSQATISSIETPQHRLRLADQFVRLASHSDLITPKFVEPRRTTAAPSQAAEVRLDDEVRRMAARMTARSKLLRGNADSVRTP